MSETPTDHELYKFFLYMFILWIVFAIICFSLPYIAILGVVFLIAAIIFIIIYAVKPKSMREKLLEKWNKAQENKKK